MPESLSIKLRFALGEIDRELADLQPLYDYANQKDLDRIYTMAAAGALHGLYGGVKSIFKMVQAGYYRNHYSSLLDPVEVRGKLLRFPAVWKAVKAQIERFMEEA